MPTIIDNLNSTTPDRTVQIFDNFYNINLNINASDYDVVFSFFENISKNQNIANNFTTTLFRISQELDIDVLELLKQMEGINNTLEITKVMCYLLNSFKVKTVLYGVGVTPRPNQSVARNVVL
jgi:hypothetical protein